MSRKGRRKERIKLLREKLKSIDTMTDDELNDAYSYIFSLGQGDGERKTTEKYSKGNLTVTKQFIETVFLSGVQVGLMKRDSL